MVSNDETTLECLTEHLATFPTSAGFASTVLLRWRSWWVDVCVCVCVILHIILYIYMYRLF